MTAPTFQETCKRFFDRFNEITKPQEKYFSKKEKFELDHIRNKTLLLIHGLHFLQLFISMILGKNELIFNIQALIGTASICAVLILSCHLGLHPQIFKLIYNFYLFFFGVSLMTNGDHGMIGAWMITSIFPMLVYFLTGSLHHFLVHIVCKAILINTLYQNGMKTSLAYMTPDEAVRALTHFTNQNNVCSLACTLFIHYSLQKAFSEVLMAEEKAEKQKNSLFGFSLEVKNMCKSLIENMKSAALEKPSEKVKNLLLNAQTSVELLHHQANNISDIQQNEIDKLEINPKSVSTETAIDRIWDVCSELMRRNNLRGRMKITKNIPKRLIFDHYRVTQICLNLIRNMVKHSKSGNVDVTIDWIKDVEAVNDTCYQSSPLNGSDNQDFVFLDFGQKTIDLNLMQNTRKAGILKISANDIGCGISKEENSGLFPSFPLGLVDPANSKVGDQDLFLTQVLCQRMNGGLRAFTQKGKGLIVCLPIMQKKLKVLVVDDIDFCVGINKLFLENIGIDNVEEATNGLEAYEKYTDCASRKDYFDLILMDIQMPVMDGITASRKIRGYETLNHLKPCPILMVTAACAEREKKECMDKNGQIKAYAYFRKPMVQEDLRVSISGLYEGKTQVT